MGTKYDVPGASLAEVCHPPGRASTLFVAVVSFVVVLLIMNLAWPRLSKADPGHASRARAAASQNSGNLSYCNVVSSKGSSRDVD